MRCCASRTSKMFYSFLTARAVMRAHSLQFIYNCGGGGEGAGNGCALLRCACTLFSLFILPGSGCTPTARRWWRWGQAAGVHPQHGGGGGGGRQRVYTHSMAVAVAVCHAAAHCSSHMTAASGLPACMSSASSAARRFTWHAAITKSMASSNRRSCLWVRGGDGCGGRRLCT